MTTVFYVVLVIVASCFPYAWSKWLLRRDRRNAAPVVDTETTNEQAA